VANLAIEPVSIHPYTVQTDDTLKVRFSATVGEEPEVEVGLV
jgi:hypothetical protein